MTITRNTREAYCDLSQDLLHCKAKGLSNEEIAQAIVLAMNEAGIKHHELTAAYLTAAYDELNI